MKNCLLFCCFLIATTLVAQKKPLSYYLPDNIEYDKNIPTPESFFGFQVGEQHLSHDQIVAYMHELDRVSDRITLEVVGRSYEFRPLMVLTITLPENHQNLAKIRADHVALTDPSVSGSLDIAKIPAVVYQGYSIHGNEPSGANAGVLAAYFWAAAQGKEVEETLRNVVILHDPAFNPDGIQRFSQWVNMHRAKNLVSDPASREFSEFWPYGRTNHYWFDLNRDWLVAQMPESRGRVRVFHEWKPNVLTDHHEMGSQATFFFQPGVPSRVNPFTPKKNQELTAKIGEFHAKALNKIGSMYYTKQGYDDFYYGKGSTYPDVNGAVGILFEQASSRGHAQRTTNGVLTFPFTVRNQLTTSFSTVEAAKNLRADLLSFQRDFYKNAADEAKRDTRKGYIFGDKYDASRVFHFLEILKRNQIKVYELGQNAQGFEKGKAFVVPTEQQQYRLIKASFEKYTEGVGGFFADSLFYDISAWTLPMAFNLTCKNVDGALAPALLGKEIATLEQPVGSISGGQSSYGYVFEWDDFYAPQLLSTLLKDDLLAKVMMAKTKIELNESAIREFERGAIFIPAQNQPKSADYIFNAIQNAVKKTGVTVFCLKTGLATEGVDLGGPSAVTVRRPNVALLVGEGVNNNDAGEIWHLLDQRYDVPCVLLDQMNLRNSLSSYTHIVLVDGNYGSPVASKLKDYTENGGTLIAFGRAVKFLKSNELAHFDLKQVKENKGENKRRPYANLENDEGAHVIGGAIFEAEADLTHPLLFGFHESKIPVFRGDTIFMEPTRNVYATPLAYTSNPLLSGYVSQRNKELAKNAASIVVSSANSGRSICMIDNPAFRAFWFGTNKLFANMIFFSNLIQSNALEQPKKK